MRRYRDSFVGLRRKRYGSCDRGPQASAPFSQEPAGMRTAKAPTMKNPILLASVLTSLSFVACGGSSDEFTVCYRGGAGGTRNRGKHSVRRTVFDR